MTQIHLPKTVSVCICTFKRPQLLRRTLEGVVRQETSGQFTFSIIVVDNDATQSASVVVEEVRAISSVEITYCCEPEQNISLARNKALEHATGNYVACLDDDEFPEKDWLLTLIKACECYSADGVLGPVRPWFDQPPPSWIIRGRFCERPEHPTGFLLHYWQTRTGNVLFRRRILDGIQVPFRREFGNGGEDQDFFRRMIQNGCRFVWCNEALVHEVVPPDRWERRYMLRRALLRGQNEKLLLTPISLGKSILAVPFYALILPFLLLAGHHVFMSYAIRLLDHAGKLLGAMGLKPAGDQYLSRKGC